MSKIKVNVINPKQTIKVGDSGVWTGTINKVIYTGQNDYAIVSLKLDNGPTCTACGTIPYPEKGISVKVTGSVKFNSKYAQEQIYVESCTSNMSDNDLAAIKFLSSGPIKGVGPATAKTIVLKYGSEDLDAVLSDTDKLLAVPGISSAKVNDIQTSYAQNKDLFVLYKLTTGNITVNMAQKIKEQYGDHAYNVVSNDPYRLIYDIDGIGFLTADNLAMKIGLAFNCKERITAGIIYCLRQAALESGHCYLPKSMLEEKLSEFLFSSKELMRVFYQDVYKTTVPNDTTEWDITKLHLLQKDKATRLNNILSHWSEREYRQKTCKAEKFTDEEIDCLDIFVQKKAEMKYLYNKILEEMALDARQLNSVEAYAEITKEENQDKKFIIQYGKYGEDSIFEKELFIHECYIANSLDTLSSQPAIKFIDKRRISEAIDYVESQDGYELDEDQKQAIKMMLNNRVSVLTGGPGRGKTTIIRAAVFAWKHNNNGMTVPAQVVLLAPTGKASMRMSEATSHPAYTIHRFLIDLKTGTQLLSSNTLVIIDECSMVDIYLMERLLRSINGCQICFVGDKDQLPSVSAGACLEDMISSGVIPCTMLTTCHRNEGSILNNSYVINNGGRLQELETDLHFKTVWLTGGADVIKQYGVNMYQNLLPKYSKEEIVILTPMLKGDSGVQSMNIAIQNAVNPKSASKKELTIGYTDKITFREGDRVVQAKNLYNLPVTLANGSSAFGVFNGETGTITKIDPFKEKVTILFDDGKIGYYERTDMFNVLLAYAMTYHKSQGSEFKCVICLLATANYVLLQKKILYTGESRAKDLCVFLGHAKAFSCALNNVGVVNERYTSLSDKIKEFVKQAS